MKSHRSTSQSSNSKRSIQSAPLTFAATSFGLGVWLAGALQSPVWLWASASLALVFCTLAAAAIGNYRLGYAAGFPALACAGAFARLWMPTPAVVLPPPEFLYDHPIEIIGHVTNDGAMLAGRQPRERFDLETEQIQLDDATFIEPFGLRATLFAGDRKRVESEENEYQTDEDHAGFPLLVYGERIKFTAKLRLPRNFHNPGSFDYEGYLHGLGISTLASVSAKSIEILPPTQDFHSWGFHSWGFLRSQIRRSILSHVHSRKARLWSEEDAALFAAMIVGDDSLLLRHVREEFQETGVYHLLVVSGMNVGLLAFAVFWLARRFRAPEWLASLVTIGLSLFYAAVAGFGSPILRAVFMLSVYLGGRLLYRDRAALNTAGFAALAVLVLSPTAWFEPAFQLTFLALFAISGIGLPILERTSAPYRQALAHIDSTGYDLTLEPRLAQFRLDLRLLGGRVEKLTGVNRARFLLPHLARLVLSIYDLIVVSSITQAVLVLPMREGFHRAALTGLPANLLVLPLAGILLNSGVAAIALSYVSSFLAKIAGYVASTALHLTLSLIATVSGWSVSQWRIADAGLTISLIAATGILIAFVVVRSRKAVTWAGIALLFLSAGLAALYRPAARLEPGKLEITAIDVGQGDSLLIVSPQGQTMLVDGGGAIGPGRSEFDYGEDVISPYLWSRGISQLDVVVLTHAHDDHIGGLPRIVENFHPRELWLGINPPTRALDRLIQAASRQNMTILSKAAGQTCDWGGTTIRVLSPPLDWEPKPKPRNDDSLAFLISYGQNSALMTGDVEKKMERFIAAENPQADLLKVAHHGSATSTTPELLEAVHPKFAVISDGFHNSFGHPRAEVLDRLSDAHVKVYRTDMLGMVQFLMDGKNVETRIPTN